MNNKGMFPFGLRAFFIMVAIVVLVVLATSAEQKEDNIKEKFCNEYNLSYRDYDCGFHCYKEECYGSKGAFELESKYNARTQQYSFILIGVDALDAIGETESKNE